MDVTFTDIVVTHPATTRTLLHGISGRLVPGRLTALMGPSGGGKTTLLTTLARRFEVALDYRGSVRYDGGKWDPVRHKRRVAFVPQDDVFPVGVTVREHLEFSARLRLADLTPAQRAARVDAVIKKLRLDKCQNTVIGAPGGMRGVSGGERKRVCIANELLTEPSLLLCDEPTSGLDSSLSAVVLDTLADLARDGITVVCTIHQPSTALFSRFDDLIALDAGRLFYRGPRDGLTQYLADEMGRVCPAYMNPADFLIDILVMDESRNSDARVQSAMARLSAAKPSGVGGNKTLAASGGSVIAAADSDATDPDTHPGASFLVQTSVLFQRMFKRTGGAIFSTQQIISECGLVVVPSILWWQLGWGINTAFLRASAAFWIVTADAYLAVFSTIFALQEEEPLLRKDLFDGSYSLAAYYTARALAALPNNAFWSVFYSAIMLACTNLAPSAGLAVAIVVTMQLVVLIYQSVGFLLSASLQPFHIMTATVVFITAAFAFSGFFAAPSAMPSIGYYFLRWIDPHSYIWQLVMNIIMQPWVSFSCDAATASNAACGGSATATLSGTQALASFEVTLAPWISVVVIVLATLGLHLLAFACFAARARRWRGAKLLGRGDKMVDVVANKPGPEAGADADASDDVEMNAAAPSRPSTAARASPASSVAGGGAGTPPQEAAVVRELTAA